MSVSNPETHVYNVQKIPSVFSEGTPTKDQLPYESMYAYAMMVKMMKKRETHMEQVRMNTITSPHYILTHSKDKLLEMWKNAKPKVENVAGAICIMLVLPKLPNPKLANILKLYPISKNTIRVVFKFKNDKVTQLRYSEKFTFKGHDVNIKPDDLSYAYKADYGGLFIYINNIQVITLNPLAHTRKHLSSRPITDLLYENPHKPQSLPSTSFKRRTPGDRSIHGGRRTRKRNTGRRHKKRV
jgi:hypothetical protein